MLKRFLILLLFAPVFLFGWSSCNNKVNNQLKQAIICKKDSCRLDPQHSYQVFVPAVEKKCENLPLLVVIDSHGAGEYAVNQFKDAAQKYPAVVVASNLIKNNFPGYIQSLDELITDVKSKYPVGKMLYISGFSGGARMAIDYAMKHRVDGVIACGALAQAEQIKAVGCPLMAVIGMDDFNFVEAAQYIVNPANAPNNLLIELTNASHAWPEKRLLTQAMGYMQLSTSKANKCINARPLIKSYVLEQKNRIDSLSRSEEVIKAAMVARNLSNSEIFEKNGSFRPSYDAMIHSQAYNQQMDELTKSIRFELKVREAYYNALQQKDSLWWKKEITSLNSKIGSEQNLYTQMAYRRIKGFLGIVCFSMSNQYASAKAINQLEQILAVYRAVEPENEDMKNFANILMKLKSQSPR